MSSDTLPPSEAKKDLDQPPRQPTPTSDPKAKPPIPIGRKWKNENTKKEGQDEDENEKEDIPVEETFLSSMLLASSLGLNQIRTRSTFSPLRVSSSFGASSHLGAHYCKLNAETHLNPKWKPPHADVGKKEQGKTVHWSRSKSLGNPSPFTPVLEGSHAAFAREIQSPRFQAILRVTGSRKKLRNPDLKAFSQELNSKGVGPHSVWKYRALVHMEEVMVAIRAKFEGLKEEVNSDLGAFTGDLLGTLEKISHCHPEWKESLEDLLAIARQCAKMSPDEFWLKCEGIVMNLDERRQDLPMGILKQAHTRLLFILTRCSRLVQFQKEGVHEDDHILGLHHRSDLGVYSEQILNATGKDEKEKKEKQTKMSQGKDQGDTTLKEDQIDQNVIVEDENIEVCTAKSVDSTSSSYRMSSWKKFPSAAEKNRKDPYGIDTPPKGRLDKLEFRDEGAENLDSPSCPTENLEPPSRAHAWGSWDEHQNFTYENSMICRICEFEIPVIHVEEHSLICAIADRCDMKGLTVNERLERLVETIEKILELWTPKSTPKDYDTPRESFEGARVSASSVQEEFDEFSPRKNISSHRCSDDMIGYTSESDGSYTMDDLNVRSDISCETSSCIKPVQGIKSSSGGSLTPRSPLLTRASPIEMLFTGRRAIAELENYQQISKLLEIARSVANVDNCEYSALEFMLDQLEELKYAIHDRNVDALVVETFGRRIEKLLQEKYVYVYGQIEDEKIDTSNVMADEESSMEEDTSRSARASPITPCSKDRTSIEDFEIIKPISRGAYGRVFLARKRATGDMFAMKVLKKADMTRKNAVESILAERNILISTHNPFVVRFYYSFTCRENLYLVMEYLNGGDLYSLLRSLGCLDEDMARIYIAEVVLALEYMHSLNVIHRDLKPDNLLINQDGHIKLTDFGLSKVGLINSTNDLSGPSVATGFLRDDEPKAQHHAKREQRQKQSVVGTPDYLAPEILLGMGHGTTADWWSVGVILFELLVGIPPFNSDHPQKIFDSIINREIPWPKVPEEMSHEAYDLIDKLLTENPVQRLGATGAREVKQHQFFKDINWNTLARQKAMFIPSAEAHDTSYFMSRYIWNPEDEQIAGGSDFDDLTDTGSSRSCSNIHDEDDDECGSLTEFAGPTLAVKYSFSNFSFKNLSQLASMNYDLVVKNSRGSPDDPRASAQQ